MVESNSSDRTHATSDNNDHRNFNKTSTTWNAEQFIYGALNALHKLCLHGSRHTDRLMSELGGNEFVKDAVNWCIEHPDIICAIGVSCVVLMPLLIIVVFGITTMLITLTGILVLEGTLLTVVIMIFLVCIGAFAITISIFTVVAFFGFSQICDFFGFKRHRDISIKTHQNDSRI